ncbi:MAG: hypothetical protein E7439_03465 [Ruminococcaceae bacterium]|nr:hypothetical protein [Oscillospiraceae bacterium]
MTVFEMIEAQQKGREDTTIFMVGEQLKDICRADPACAVIVAEDLSQKAMSIEACEKKIKEHADKLKNEKKLRAVGISPQKAEEIIRKFYGLPERTNREAQTATPNNATQTGGGLLSLEDLLGI